MTEEELMTETLLDLAPASGELNWASSLYNCPQCGSFLDAPRVHPPSGEQARKCSSCQHWYRVSNGRPAPAK
jgi:transposase-like protein